MEYYSYSQIASIAIGYNNPKLLEAAQSTKMASALVNRPAMGNFPQHDWADILESGLMKVAPRGMTHVLTAHTGSDANELAYKAAFLWKRLQQRREERGNGSEALDFTPEEMSSSMENKAPGSPSLAILSFKGAFHGRMLASLSTTRSKPIHKVDIPAFPWPQAPFPARKYPLEQYAAENADIEEACLRETEEIILRSQQRQQREKQGNQPTTEVAAVVIEPVQSEGGDNHASPFFFNRLRSLTRKHGVLLIVDEVQTGVGATGRFWAHEHWHLTDPPDMVTFSKKAQAAGYYYYGGSKDSNHKTSTTTISSTKNNSATTDGNLNTNVITPDRPNLRPDRPYRQFNTWMGDPARAILFNAILSEITRLDLVRHTAETGDYLYRELTRLRDTYPHEMLNLRGRGMGTFIAWDSPRRDEMLKKAKSFGINLGGSGERAVRLRPMLVFQKRHADILLDRLEKMVQH